MVGLGCGVSGGRVMGEEDRRRESGAPLKP